MDNNISKFGPESGSNTTLATISIAALGQRSEYGIPYIGLVENEDGIIIDVETNFQSNARERNMTDMLHCKMLFTIKIKQILYTVRKDDTLSEIAKRYNTTVDKIMEDNKIVDPDSNLVNKCLSLRIDRIFAIRKTIDKVISSTPSYNDSISKIPPYKSMKAAGTVVGRASGTINPMKNLEQLKSQREKDTVVIVVKEEIQEFVGRTFSPEEAMLMMEAGIWSGGNVHDWGYVAPQTTVHGYNFDHIKPIGVDSYDLMYRGGFISGYNAAISEQPGDNVGTKIMEIISAVAAGGDGFGDVNYDMIHYHRGLRDGYSKGQYFRNLNEHQYDIQQYYFNFE